MIGSESHSGHTQNISPIKERILAFVDIQGISKRVFYSKTGISRGTLESKTGITEETLAKFIAIFPQINISWLLLGKGEMVENNIKRAPPKDKCGNCEVLEARLKDSELIISALKSTVEAKDELIAMLKQKASDQDNIETSPEKRKIA